MGWLYPRIGRLCLGAVMTVLHHDVKAWFNPTDARCPETIQLRYAAMDLGLLMLANMVQGPELDTALRMLRQSVMWAEDGVIQRLPAPRLAQQA